MPVTSNVIVGANAGRSRAHNRRVVLGHMRAEGTIGRAELARRTGLSTQAVSNIIAELEADGLIEATGTRNAGRGLPAMQYALHPQGAYALGYEVRPDAVFVVLMALDGREYFSERKVLTRAGPKSVCEEIVHLRDASLAAASVDPDRLLGAGVVMPGPFDETGVSGQGSELPGWQNTAPQDVLSDALGLMVVVENDANAAAMAERVAGSAKDFSDYVFVYFGTGLGLGILSDGRLERGSHGNAGEIGHIPVYVDGQLRLLENVVSRLALREHMEQAGTKIDESSDLQMLFSAGQTDLIAWLDQAAMAMSQAVLILENLFDPQSIILGGAMPDEVLDYIISKIDPPDRSVANRPNRSHPRLLRGGSGRMTATRGAAALVINQTFTPHIQTAAE